MTHLFYVILLEKREIKSRSIQSFVILGNKNLWMKGNTKYIYFAIFFPPIPVAVNAESWAEKKISHHKQPSYRSIS